ncbi:MAG: DUF4197 domain-containing protein [Bacteroidota bacterium]|nr:DUF4197 domain-containing protein [Bacteroidota bacterium]
MKKFGIIAVISLFFITSCDILANLNLEDFEGVIQEEQGLTNTEIIKGLKDALAVGTGNAVSLLNKEDAFNKNPKFRIPFPKEVVYVEEKLRSIGLDKVVDDFELQMNRAAEKAVVKAKPIFVSAVKNMSFADAKNILTGPDNAATEYFKKQTSNNLIAVFKPQVQNTLDEISVTKYWNNVTSAYNKIPFTKKVETDLAQYVTQKTLNALFIQLAVEEKEIRENPIKRTTAILKKVFGSLDK